MTLSLSYRRLLEDPQLVKAAAGNEASDDAVENCNRSPSTAPPFSSSSSSLPCRRAKPRWRHQRRSCSTCRVSSTPPRFNSRPRGSRLKRSRRWAAPRTGHLTSLGGPYRASSGHDGLTGRAGRDACRPPTPRTACSLRRHRSFAGQRRRRTTTEDLLAAAPGNACSRPA